MASSAVCIKTTNSRLNFAVIDFRSGNVSNCLVAFAWGKGKFRSASFLICFPFHLHVEGYSFSSQINIP